MSKRFTELMVEGQRDAGMKRILKAYRPTVPVAAVVTALAMRSEDEARAYLDDVSMQLEKDGAEVDTKSSTFHRKPKEKEGNTL